MSDPGLFPQPAEPVKPPPERKPGAPELVPAVDWHAVLDDGTGVRVDTRVYPRRTDDGGPVKMLALHEVEQLIKRLHQMGPASTLHPLDVRALANSVLRGKAAVLALFKVIGANEAACGTCFARILWVVTKNGKPAPYDYDGVSHFGTCPSASQHRRPKPPPDEHDGPAKAREPGEDRP